MLALPISSPPKVNRLGHLHFILAESTSLGPNPFPFEQKQIVSAESVQKRAAFKRFEIVEQISPLLTGFALDFVSARGKNPFLI